MSNSDPTSLVFTMGVCLLVAGVLAIPVMGWLPLVAVAGMAAVIAFGCKSHGH
jgi:hypothetical protein